MNRALAAVVSLSLVATVHAAQRNAPIPSIDLVELDVAVVDRHNQPVTGLTAQDFVVKDDGANVEIKTFTEAKSSDSTDPDHGRLIVVALDDSAVAPIGTQAMQTIANAIVMSADERDQVSVVRLHNRDDEPFGDRTVAQTRIARFRAGSAPFADSWTAPETLARMADVARQLESDDHRRKLIVCVGAPIVCNIEEPSSGSARPMHWTTWVDAITATARASVAVYAVIPGRAMLRGGGLAELTGGEVFATMHDVGPAIDRILRDASHYYMLGYWPTGKSKELHSIDVKVLRRDVTVHARRRRGN